MMTKTVIKNASKSGTPEGMTENFKKATVELASLQLLTECPMYVYQMIKAFQSRSEGRYKVATLYYDIYRMEKFGYIEEFESKISEDNHLLMYYCITEEGKAYLAALDEEFKKINRGIQLIIKG